MATKELLCGGRQFELNYEIVNPTAESDLLLLHGWGANKEIMKQAFGAQLLEFRHIYLDLPGFGKSSNDYTLTTYDYCDIIKGFLESIDSSVKMVIGHSFGGKIATLLNPKILILLSSAGIPKEKSLKVKTKIAIAKALKPLLGDAFSQFFRTKDAEGLPQNMYETLKNVVDEDFSSEFSKCTSKTLIFWGKNDDATPLGCGKKINSLIKDSMFYEFDGDHYFFLFHAKKICEIVESEIGSSDV